MLFRSVYWKTGRYLEARYQWNYARDLGPEPEDLTRIQRKIDKGLEDPAPSASAAEPKKDGG